MRRKTMNKEGKAVKCTMKLQVGKLEMLNVLEDVCDKCKYIDDQGLKASQAKAPGCHRKAGGLSKFNQSISFYPSP
jgi:hypothetical protein